MYRYVRGLSNETIVWELLERILYTDGLSIAQLINTVRPLHRMTEMIATKVYVAIILCNS